MIQRIRKKEFNCYFENYAEILDKEIHLAVKSEINGKDLLKSMELEALSKLKNDYWHLAQDFYPRKFYRMWLRKELSCLDNIFENMEKGCQKKELEKIIILHGKRLLSFIENTVGYELEELTRGSFDYFFYKKMKRKGESILAKCKSFG